MPFCDGCDEIPFRSADEGLDFAEQVLTMVSFLHSCRIAHLDIAYENILMNHHGEIPKKYNQPPEFRSTFPVQYIFIDFGLSIHRPSSSNPSDRILVDPLRSGRPTKAPESTERKCDPFAADVYQTAQMLYGFIHDIVPDVPGLLELLQDMTYYRPSRRIPASVALTRLQVLRGRVPNPKMLQQSHELEWEMHRIPMRYWSWLLDIVWFGQFTFAWQYLIYFRRDLLRPAW